MYFVFGCFWDSSTTCVCVEACFHFLTFVFFAGCVFIGASSSIVKADNSFEKEKLKVEEATGKFEK